PAAFDQVVSRAMAKNPDDRYQSAGDLGDAAMVAAGELRQAGAESVVATGPAAPVGPQSPQAPATPAQAAQAEVGAPREERKSRGGEVLPFAIAVGILVVLVVLVLIALSAISKL
ncbi:MAG TPA: hypothetical protein VK304_12095, partial [Thermoleophilaceae bacterium]|nr:hypothetical protein [Thermoleophilaceae bacterium]